MAPLSLLESVRAAFGASFVQNASAYLGDPENAVRRSLDEIIPVSLAAIINKAETETADSVAALATVALQQDRYSNPAAQFVSGGEGVPPGAPDLVKEIFGERFGAIANAVATSTGGRSSTISALFNAVVPCALALIGRHLRENNLPAGALSAVLAGQKSSVWASVPADLKLSSLLGVPARPAPSYVAAGAMPTERGTPWLAPIVLLLVAGSFAWWALRSRATEPVASAGLDTAPRPAAAPNTVAAQPRPDSQAARPDTVAAGPVILPNGVKLDAANGGFEDRLVTFLSDPNAKPDENRWFDFTHLDFEPGTARIVGEGRKEVTNLAQILKAFPSVRIKIGGFSDSSTTVTDSVARKLTKARAEAVAKELRDAGVGGQVAGVDGYGSAFAKLPASAPEADRRSDRRLGVAVWVR